MMENTVGRLLKKYMDGLTTNAEEKTLRDYFSNPSAIVPEEWKPYRALFSFVGEQREEFFGGSMEEADGGAMEEKNGNGSLDEKTSGEDKRRKRHVRGLVWTLSAAATLLLLVGVFFGRQRQPDCYMIVDGKMYTDRKEVKAEAVEALEMVGENSEDPFAAMDMMRYCRHGELREREIVKK